MTDFDSRPCYSFDFKEVQYRKQDWIATITIDRPQAFNAYSTACLAELTAAFRGDVGVEAHLHLVEDVVAAIELRRPLLRRVQQIPQGGHGAVVQIRRARPHAIQRMVGVAVGLAEAGEAEAGVWVERVLVGRELVGV